MALTWENRGRKDHSSKVISESYRAQLPHWGEASVHPHIHHPGEMFLDCPALGIDMHPLGHVLAEDSWDPANAVLLRTLKNHGIWCLEAMAAIGAIDAAESH